MFKNLDDMDEKTLVEFKGALESNISSPLERLAHFAILYLKNEVNGRLGILAEEQAKNVPDLTASVDKDDPAPLGDPALRSGDALAKPNTTTNPTDKASLKPNEVT